jgi:HSP20 family molecular chaperone IbpA
MDSILRTDLPAYDFWTASAFDRYSRNPSSSLKMDLVENDSAFVVTAHVPGAKKEDIKVFFENDTLTVAVNRSEEHDVTKNKVHFKECFHSSVSRSLGFQHGKVDYNNITAKYQDGQLIIELNFNKDYNENTSVEVNIN